MSRLIALTLFCEWRWKRRYEHVLKPVLNKVGVRLASPTAFGVPAGGFGPILQCEYFGQRADAVEERRMKYVARLTWSNMPLDGAGFRCVTLQTSWTSVLAFSMTTGAFERANPALF